MAVDAELIELTRLAGSHDLGKLAVPKRSCASPPRSQAGGS
jgi:hypothetical protein